MYKNIEKVRFVPNQHRRYFSKINEKTQDVAN